MENDTCFADRKHRNGRVSASRMQGKYESDNNDDFLQRDGDNDRSRRFDDRQTQRKHYSDDADDQTVRTVQRGSPVSSCRNAEQKISERYRSRSRSPCQRKTSGYFIGSKRQLGRSDSSTNRNSRIFPSSTERTAHIGSSSCNRSYTRARGFQAVEHNSRFDSRSRHSVRELENRKYEEVFLSYSENEHRPRFSNTGQVEVCDRRISERTASNHCVEQVTNDKSHFNRQQSNRQSHVKWHEERQHSHQSPAGLIYRKDDFKDSSMSNCRCSSTSDHSQSKSSCTRHHERLSYHNATSLAKYKDKINDKSYRGSSDEDRKKRSSVKVKPCLSDNNSVSSSVRQPQTDTGSGWQKSASTNCEINATSKDAMQSDRIRVCSKHADKPDNSSSHEEPGSSRDPRQYKNYSEVLPSHFNRDKHYCVIEEHRSDGNIRSQCSNKEHLGSAQFLQRPPQLGKPADDVSALALMAVGKQSWTDHQIVANVPSLHSSGYCPVCTAVALPAPAAQANIYAGSSAHLLLQSGQQWASGGCDQLHRVHSHWPTSVEMARHQLQWPTSVEIATGHLTTASTRRCDLLPTSALAHLPLLSTKLPATIPTTADKDNVRMSLNTSLSLCSLPSSALFGLSGLQSSGQVNVDEHILNNVYGDSPLLDEPTYHLPVAVPNSTLNSSRNSTDVRPEFAGILPPVDDVDLKKMLDVVTVAKTSLEQTLHTSSQADPASGKNLKVASVDRVADEVKSALKPFFLQNEIDKEEYKDIMRKAVPKITSSKAGIDTKRIREFIASYVTKVKAAQKKALTERQHLVRQRTVTNDSALSCSAVADAEVSVL